MTSVANVPASSSSVPTPFGPFWVRVEGDAVTAAGWSRAQNDLGAPRDPLLIEALEQVGAYFRGRLTRFDLALAPRVAREQRAFMDALLAIPFGQTWTYGEMGRSLGITAQAAGRACGRNPIPLIVPCHRVIGAGNLGGFSAPGGIETKIALLRHEGAAGLLI